MLSIYADNFRGFSKTTIDFSRVNFLVGENSTGKTSILSLFSLLQDQTFWFGHEFNTAVVNLGYFDEISSGRADDRFTVGLGETELQTPFFEKPERRYYLLEFSNRDNIPTLSSVRLRSATIDVFVKWDGEKLIYGVETCHGTTPTFAEWVKSRLPDVSAERTKGTIVDRLAQRPALHIFLQAIEEGFRDKRVHRMWDLFYPPFGSSSVAWIAPIRAKPKRTYDSFKVSFSPEGEHSPYVLKDLLTSRLRAHEAVKELKTFGKTSGLFKTIKIHSHGRGKTAPFEIYIQVAGKPFKIANVGYGVAQVLPIIVELISRQPNTWFSIQQPEIHLHPKAQAELGGHHLFVC